MPKRINVGFMFCNLTNTNQCQTLALLQHCFGIASILLRHCFGIALALLWHCFGIALALLWHCFNIALALFQHCFNITSTLLRPNSEKYRTDRQQFRVPLGGVGGRGGGALNILHII